MAKFQRICVFLLILSLIFALAACKAEDPAPTEAPTTPENMTVYTATSKWDNVTYTVNKENCTVTDGKYTYFYEFEGNASNYKVTITYPDGKTDFWIGSPNGGSGGGIGFGTDYADCCFLAEVIAMGAPKAPAPTVKPEPSQEPNFYAQFMYTAILFLLGFLFLVFPEAMARRKIYFWAKNAEPSDFAIGFYRVLGAFCILVGVISIFL